MKNLTQKNKLLDFLLNSCRQLLQVVARYKSIAVGEEDSFAVYNDRLWLSVDLYTCLLGKPSKCPNVVVTNEEVDLYSFFTPVVLI